MFNHLQNIGTNDKNSQISKEHSYPFSNNIPIMEKLGDWFSLAKCMKNTCEKLTFLVNLQVINLQL